MTSVLTLIMVVQPASAATEVNYGESYYIQNQESSSENYLSISPGLPGFQCSGTTKHDVFTDSVLDLAMENC
jgi:pyoverdine/dityrosine biosynthesis protein Dit1